MSEILEIDGKQYPDKWDILDGDEFEKMTIKNTIDKRRWCTLVSKVVMHKKTGKFFDIEWLAELRKATPQPAASEGNE